jgi:hypothetical protein
MRIFAVLLFLAMFAGCGGGVVNTTKAVPTDRGAVVDPHAGKYWSSAYHQWIDYPPGPPSSP